MQTATSETESKSLDLSICVHHYTLRAPCPKGQGTHIPPRSRFVTCSSGVRREAFAVAPGTEGCGTRMDRSPNGRAEAVCAPSVPQ